MADSIDINQTSLEEKFEQAKINYVKEADFQVAAQPMQPGNNLKEGPSTGGIMKRYHLEAPPLQHDADAQIQKLVSGETQDLHEITAAMDEAQTSFELMMEIRNQLVDAYQEVMKMR